MKIQVMMKTKILADIKEGGWGIDFCLGRIERYLIRSPVVLAGQVRSCWLLRSWISSNGINKHAISSDISSFFPFFLFLYAENAVEHMPYILISSLILPYLSVGFPLEEDNGQIWLGIS